MQTIDPNCPTRLDESCVCGNRAGLRAAWWRLTAGYAAAAFGLQSEWVTPSKQLSCLQQNLTITIAEHSQLRSVEGLLGLYSCTTAGRGQEAPIGGSASTVDQPAAWSFAAVVRDPIDQFEWALSQAGAPWSGASCSALLGAISRRGFFDPRIAPQSASPSG